MIFTVRLRHETCRRQTECHLLREIFRATDRYFSRFLCSDIGKSASFAEARSLLSLIKEMKDD
jgi:hypothetical protein